MRVVTLGADPGDVWTGYAILAWEGAGLPLVVCAGMLPPDAAPVALAALAREHGVQRAAVERSENVYPGGNRACVVARGGAVARANWIGGELSGRLAALGVHVESPTAQAWHVALTGLPSPAVSHVHAALRHAVQAWQDPPRPESAKETDREHPRDGCGLALFSLRSAGVALPLPFRVAA